MTGRAGLLLIVLLALFARLPHAAAAPAFDFAFQPHPGAELPLNAGLVDESGRKVVLGRYFGKKPVILVLEYLRCRTLCGVTLQNLVATLDKLPFEAGRDFELLAISIDPRDRPADAAAAKAKYLAAYHRRDAGRAGVHFLTGPASSVARIAAKVGFPYKYDKALDQYIHPAGFVVAAPGGGISRYLLGVAMTPADLTGALADAEENKALGPVARILLLCHVNGIVGTYTVPVLAAFTAANFAAMFALVAIFAAIRRNRHR
jgi:protein SCO1/2